MGERVKVSDPEKLTLLYERFRDVCLVEKRSLERDLLCRGYHAGRPVRTNIQDRYDVEIDDIAIEDTLEANIPLGKASLEAAIQEYRSTSRLSQSVMPLLGGEHSFHFPDDFRR